MNFLRARLLRRNGHAVVAFKDNELALPESVEQRHERLSGYLNREVIVGIRPEDLEDAVFVRDAQPDSTLPVTVSLAEQLGSEIAVHFELDEPPVVVQDTIELAADTEGTAEPAGEGEPAVAVAEQGSGRTRCVARLHPRSNARAGGRVQLAVDTLRLHFFDPETQDAI
jgi:multiple sugar transport system ATP-binding protein